MTKITVIVMAAIIIATSSVPAMASVAHVEADSDLRDLQILAAHDYGVTITHNKWVQGNDAWWRKVYATQGGRRIAILLQWESYNGLRWFTVSTKDQRMNIGKANAYLGTQIYPTIVSVSVNEKSFGFRLKGTKDGDYVVIRQFSADGRRAIENVRSQARNGSWWFSRKKRAVRAVVEVHCGSGETIRNIRFWEVAVS